MSGQVKPPDDESCGNCRFIRQGPTYLRCCRFPPISNPTLPTNDGSATGFPIVRPDNWCGEFKPG
jgi:hypothetical protein